MSSTKLKRTLALALAGGSLAIGVPAALAATGGDAAPASTGGASAPTFIQDQPQDRARPDRGDCPEHDGAGRDGSSGESGSAGQGGTTEAPSV